jgi:hypothetical protein
MPQYDAQFVEAVGEGRAAIRRGDLLDHDVVVERIEQMFARDQTPLVLTLKPASHNGSE